MRCTYLLVLIALAVGGCNRPSDAAPRAALQEFLGQLTAAEAEEVCAGTTTRGVRELAHDFGGHTCTETVRAVGRYLEGAPAVRRALGRARIEPTTDVPMAPAPLRGGSDSVTLRVALRDPVVGRRQRVDITLRNAGGRWRVDSGAAALFTRL